MRLISSDRVQLQFAGETGQCYQLESSTGLVDWVPVVLFTNANGTVWFEESTASQPHRFYRSRLGP